ncbi:hypothetical protein [Paenibacillus sp. GP183]|uniref:hypothetical protein n=1 Tax=Paenibacillus sp. GP183 TaxID=1882751 RepID=UPI00089D3D1E|nr:hypothetical protein [Paenibacillus sp. GP183]SEB80430.1 hypothetical protein SAMN05443246_1965 [Paenibacillus sp. GP183]
MTTNDIIKEINTIQDSSSYIERTIDLLYEVQLSRGPLIEVVTIFKYEKPCLYSTLKKRFHYDVSFEYDLAKKSLGL